MALTAYGLYVGDKLVASVRARDAQKARDIFKKAGLEGERVRPVGKPPQGAA